MGKQNAEGSFRSEVAPTEGGSAGRRVWTAARPLPTSVFCALSCDSSVGSARTRRSSTSGPRVLGLVTWCAQGQVECHISNP